MWFQNVVRKRFETQYICRKHTLKIYYTDCFEDFRGLQSVIRKVRPSKASIIRILRYRLCKFNCKCWAALSAARWESVGRLSSPSSLSQENLDAPWSLSMPTWTNRSNCSFNCSWMRTRTYWGFEHPVNLFPVPVLTGVTVTCALFFFVGVTGNLMTILVVDQVKDMRTTTNLYLSSMAFSDLLIFLCMPLDLYRIWRYRPWNFGNVLCKLFQFCERVLHVLDYSEHHCSQCGEILCYLFSS